MNCQIIQRNLLLSIKGKYTINSQLSPQKKDIIKRALELRISKFKGMIDKFQYNSEKDVIRKGINNMKEIIKIMNC